MKHLQTENYLTAGHYSFAYNPKVPIKSIDMAGARVNPARLHRKANEEVITKYGVNMLDGVEFPAIVLFDLGTSLYALCTGLHRIEAALECKLEHFDAYLVNEPVPARRDLLTSSINSIEGHAQTHQQDLLAAAEQFRLHHGVFNQKDIARAFSLRPDAFAKFLRIQAADEHALRLGVLDQFCNLPQGMKDDLFKITIDHNFVGAVICIADYSVRGDEAEAFIKNVVKVGSEAAGHSLITKKRQELELREQRSKAKHSKTKSARSTKFVGSGKKFIGWGPLPALGLDGIEPGDISEAIDVMDQVIELATAAKKKLSQLQNEQDRKTTWHPRGVQPSAPGSHAPL